MITVRNEFEPVPAFTHIAGCSLGNWSNRETACALLKALGTVSDFDCMKLWQDIAYLEDDSESWFELQDEIAELLNDYMPMEQFCSVQLHDSEFTVLPSLESAHYDEDTTKLDDYPDDYVSDYILVVNDHGNVTCQQWTGSTYRTIWDMV